MIITAKTIYRMWAAATDDFERCIGKFLRQPSMDFQAFCAVAKRMKITLVMNACVGQGIYRHEHYAIFSRIILDAATQFWTLPRNPCAKKGGDLELRQRLGGFYLTYLLWHKQPYEGITPIILKADDMDDLKEWLEQIEEIPDDDTRLSIKMMINQLALTDGFLLSAFDVAYDIHLVHRTVLNMINNQLVKHSRVERTVQDQLVYGTTWQAMPPCIYDYDELRRCFVKSLDHTAIPSRRAEVSNDEVNACMEMLAFDPNMSTLMYEVADAVDVMARQPILSMGKLTLDNIVYHRMMGEYRVFLRRLEKKILRGRKKPASEYIKAGSYWGRKKEVDEGRDPVKRGPRKGYPRNIYIWLHGLPFSFDPEKESEEQARANAKEQYKATAAKRAQAKARSAKPKNWRPKTKVRIPKTRRAKKAKIAKLRKGKKKVVQVPKATRRRNAVLHKKQKKPAVDELDEQDWEPAGTGENVLIRKENRRRSQRLVVKESTIKKGSI